MTKQELAEEIRKGLEELRRLPPDEQIKRLIAAGTINERGEVLMGREEEKNGEQEKAGK